MKPIRTISDFRKATKRERKQAAKEVTVKKDLYSWMAWLNSPSGGQVEGTYTLGFHGRSRAKGLHPSSVSKPKECLLKLYFEVTGEVEAARAYDHRMQFIFDIGTLIHSMLQMHFTEMYGDQFVEEVGMKNKKLLLIGHTDGRFSFPVTRFLLEIKSIKEGGNFGFEKVQDRPFTDHVRQSHCYMFLSDCPFCLLFYFCKNTGEIKEHTIVWDEEVWEGLLEEPIYPVLEAVNAGKRPEAKVGWHCQKRCPYFHGCEEGKAYRGNARFKNRRSVRKRD